MKPLTPEEILPLAEYRKRRAEEQRAAIALRARRRLLVGPKVTLAFENRDTVRYQIHEMCHAESIHEPAKIAHEVDTYNQLIPGRGELSATLMIELTDLASIKQDLDGFLGLDKPGVLTLKIGTSVVATDWEPGHSDVHRIAAVHYVRFRLSPAAQSALREGAEAAIVLAHWRHRALASIEAPLRAELVADLDAA